MGSTARIQGAGSPDARTRYLTLRDPSRTTLSGFKEDHVFYEALVAGLQSVLWALGAVPLVLRHDNLSAGTHELNRTGGRQLTARLEQLLDHYGLHSSRIQPGRPHEISAAKQSHFRTKTAIEQALLLRDGRDFVDEARNARAAPRLAEERSYLRPLPSVRIPGYTTFRCVVRTWSTIRVGGRVWSVPSRLIRRTVEARQHLSTVEVLYGGRVLCTMRRLPGSAEHRIDYRHLIGSLVRRPTLHRAEVVVRRRTCGGSKLLRSSFGARGRFLHRGASYALASRHSRCGQQAHPRCRPRPRTDCAPPAPSN